MRMYGLALSMLLGCGGGDPDSSKRQAARVHSTEDRPVQETSHADCQIVSESRLSGEGIGAIRIGESILHVKASCPLTQDDSVDVEEGLRERVVAIATGLGLFRASVDSERVWRIEVDSPAPQTADSIHVGTPLRRLLALYGLRGAEGESGLFLATPTHCGMSFRLKLEIADAEHKSDWTLADLRRLPPDTPIDLILMFGCLSQRRPVR